MHTSKLLEGSISPAYWPGSYITPVSRLALFYIISGRVWADHALMSAYDTFLAQELSLIRGSSPPKFSTHILVNLGP